MSEFEDIKQAQTMGNQEPSKGGFIAVLIFLGIIALPSLIIGYLFYLIFFRIKKYKPYFSGIIFTILSLFLTLGFFIFKSKILSNYIAIYLMICSALGLIGGMILILYRGYLLKHTPELTILRGWAYDFKYKENILDKLKRKRITKGCKTGKLNSFEGAPMGILDAPVTLDDGSEYESIEPVYSYYEEALRTRFITGLTGSGKTITMLNLMKNDIDAGIPLCVIDFKKGAELAFFLSKQAQENGRKFYHFVSGRAGEYSNPYCDFQASYDPLSSGSATSKADMMLNLREWDSASDVYKGRTQSILQAIFYLLEVVDKKALPRIPWQQGGLSQFVAALKTENLFDMISWLEKDMSKRETTQGERNRLVELQSLYRELTQSTKSPLREQIEGLVIICRTLVLSSYSDWLAAGETPYHIDLFKLATSEEAPIILFQFNPNEEAEFAKYMGNIIVSDLSRASALKQKQGNKKLFGLYIDECQSLDPDKIASLVEKVRSAGFFTTLSAQSSNQISKAATRNSEDTLLALFDTINTFIIHAGATEKTAMMLSQTVSKVDKVKYKAMGVRSSGFFSLNWGNSRVSNVSSSIEQVYKVEPHEFQNLASPSRKNGYKSQAYYITKLTADPTFKYETKPVARKVCIVPNDSVLESPTEEFLMAFDGANVKVKKYYNNYVKPAVESLSKEDDVLQDDNFTIEEIEEDDYEKSVEYTSLLIENNNESKFDNHTMESNLNEALNEKFIPQKQFKKSNTRKELESTKKQTSFDKMMNKGRKSDIRINSQISSLKQDNSNKKEFKLPDLTDL